MRRCFREYEKKLTIDALWTKNRKTRKRKLARVLKRAERIVYRKFGPDPKRPPADVVELQQKVAMAEKGYNPELVYVHPSLTPQQREEAIQRLLGRAQQQQQRPADIFLLDGLLRTLRNNKPPIPILIYKQYQLLQEAGMLEVPYNFEVWPLADFVEKHIDEVSRVRKKVSSSAAAATAAAAA
ncbi:hypothetical protein EMWEY_00040620 [Eimeria maxima]|uniref:Uncharacterized protein n=1 Tax=Eimeria maxima TaxID=5804 RepID=U6MAZ3_EIMMA|nr:hypothetical protein EMWEY_00040620 [Eimeria maxima]CDJ61387.1 hypothetical protein EMWEY_00040620 [Eimeria maxima]